MSNVIKLALKTGNMKEAIIISWPDNVDDFDAQEIVEFSTDDLKIKGIQHKSNGIYAAYEWIIPTSFIVMISGLFFKSFMEEAGKDAYQMLKSRIKSYILKRREIKTQLLTASQSINKLSKTYDQSLSISLKARLNSRLLLNVMISEKVENEEAEDMLEVVFEILKILYNQYQEINSEVEINRNIRPEELYLIANPETKLWEILTPKQMSERYRNL